MGEVLDNFAVDVLRGLHGALDAAGGAHPAALAWFDKLTTGENAIRRDCF